MVFCSAEHADGERGLRPGLGPGLGLVLVLVVELELEKTTRKRN